MVGGWLVVHVLCGVWTCCWCEIVGGEIGNDEVQRENGLVRGGAQHRRRVGAACVLDWAREQGRVDDWRKVALSCVGLQRVAGSAKAVSWRHGALEEDNASLALGRVRGWRRGRRPVRRRDGVAGRLGDGGGDGRAGDDGGAEAWRVGERRRRRRREDGGGRERVGERDGGRGAASAARRGRRAARAGNAVDVADGRHEGDGRSTCRTSASTMSRREGCSIKQEEEGGG